MAQFYISPSRLARSFYHDCDRHLRYHATPKSRRESVGIPADSDEQSPVTKAILNAGYDWESRVVGELLRGQVEIAKGEGQPLHERSFSFVQSLKLLSTLPPGQWLYQPTIQVPNSFLDSIGLDRNLVSFPPCRPDLIEVLEVDGRRTLRVIDVKASDSLKASHRVQVALYALILDALVKAQALDVLVDLECGGIWLFETATPELFGLGPASQIVRSFLRDKLQDILSSDEDEAHWHLHFRCEWCEFYKSCRAEAESSDSVSLLPYLTPGARRYLREAPWADGHSIDTLESFGGFLDSPDAIEALGGCGSLRGKEQRLRNSVQALRDKQVRLHGSASLALPKMEQVRIVITLQNEPLSGKVYLAGFRRLMGKDIFKTGVDHRLFIAENAEDCIRVQRQFIESLYALLFQIHDYNSEREWKEQKGLQCYVLDSYELKLLNELLLHGLEDPEVSERSLRLLFHFQSESLAEADEHPDQIVPFPIVVLTRVIRELVALPSPLTIRLSEALRALPYPKFKFAYEDSELFAFELSNTLKSDAIFQAWNKDEPQAIEWIQEEARKRLTATGTLVDGLREKVKERLFAWPPKFKLPATHQFQNELLSRLAFVIRYESFMGAQAIKSARSRPWGERLRDGVSIPLVFPGDGSWEVLSELDSSFINDNGGFPSWVLVPEGEAGEQAQLVFNDHQWRNRMYAPRGKVRLAGIIGMDVDGDLVKRLQLDVIYQKSQTKFKQGDRAVLHPRFTDFTSARLIERIAELDALQSSDFLDLLQEPKTFCARIRESLPVWKATTAAVERSGLTSSQEQAFKQMFGWRLTLVWGPPGTGKTYFLAKAIGCLLEGKATRSRGFRVAVTAFTHSAIENVLREVQDILNEDFCGLDASVVKLGTPQTPRGKELLSITHSEAARLSPDDLVVLGGTVHAFRKALEKGMTEADLLVVDEGSQLRIGEFSLAIKALSSKGRLVIAGDDLQLPPIIKGVYPEPDDGLPGLENSIFAYLRARDNAKRPYTVKLLENWRMNETLSRFPAETLYGTGYRPANPEIASRSLQFQPEAMEENSDVESLCRWLLDPAWPLAVCILENVRATVENKVEASLVAHLACFLRRYMLEEGTKQPYPNNQEGDATFWRDGLFIVSPHHAQIRSIKRELSMQREWHSPPFVDTVDKMQGQQCHAVLVSYGVSDGETALSEAEFIYSLNRLNVSVSRAKSKTVVFLPRPLLEPSFELLSAENAALGLAHMQALVDFCREHGEQIEPCTFAYEGGSFPVTALRGSSR